MKTGEMKLEKYNFLSVMSSDPSFEVKSELQTGRQEEIFRHYC